MFYNYKIETNRDNSSKFINYDKNTNIKLKNLFIDFIKNNKKKKKTNIKRIEFYILRKNIFLTLLKSLYFVLNLCIIFYKVLLYLFF